jgi:hypothetical protein
VARDKCHFVGKPGPFLYRSGHLSSCRDYFTSALKFHRPFLSGEFLSLTEESKLRVTALIPLNNHVTPDESRSGNLLPCRFQAIPSG